MNNKEKKSEGLFTIRKDNLAKVITVVLGSLGVVGSASAKGLSMYKERVQFEQNYNNTVKELEDTKTELKEFKEKFENSQKELKNEMLENTKESLELFKMYVDSKLNYNYKFPTLEKGSSTSFLPNPILPQPSIEKKIKEIEQEQKKIEFKK